MAKILLAANKGVVFAEREDKSWKAANQALSGETITSIEANGKIILVEDGTL